MLHTSEAVSLLNGRYETTNDVTDYLNLALDAAKMSESGDFQDTLGVYKYGAPREKPNLITLQSLSLNAEDEMKDNPFYHMFRYAFWDLGYNKEGEDDGYFDGFPVESYADTVVQDLFALNIPQIESDAAIVMHVWMSSVNGVFNAMKHCKEYDAEAAIAALDIAVALWIGAGQEEGSNEKGHLLYNMAENAGERFGQDVGETEVNRRVMDGFVEIQMALQGGSCEESSNQNLRYAALRSTVYWLTGIMTVPLVQNLIHHIVNIENEGGSNMVELYALGVIPRVSTCDPRTYNRLLTLDVLNDLLVEDEDEAIKAIQDAYSCLGLTCNDVGSYMGGVVPACFDETNDSVYKLGGYKATAKSARSMAKLDQDILQIDAFLKYGSNDLALDWYYYGWNSDLSLHTLANHDFVPELPDAESSYFTIFSDFFEKSEYYEGTSYFHEKITNILLGSDFTFQDGTVSQEQLRSAVTGLLQYVIMPVTIADSLKYASSQCSKNEFESAMSFVDAAAMFYVGSMAGKAVNSGRGGTSIFAMADDLCKAFGACISGVENSGAAAINELIITSLTSIIDNIDSADCVEVQSLIEDTILPAMAIPLIQALLEQASYNQDLLPGSKDAGLADGDALARGILPLVNQASPSSADVIMVQMGFQITTQPVVDGFEAVADAFRGDTLINMGIDCAQVGIFAKEPTTGSLCGNGLTSSQSYSTQLAFGRYNFSNPDHASEHAAFALDVRDMFNANSPSDGTTIYTEGSNALDADVFVSVDDGTPSLASLSTLASKAMYDDPMFNIYKYALYEDSDFETSSKETFSYADDIVIEALNRGDDTKLAAEATVVLQIFMAITNKLYSSVRLCDLRLSPELEIDTAVALWIGDMQGEGRFDDGWMMYSIAQSVEKFFGFTEGESPVNSILMNLFLQAQTAAKTCESDPESTKTIRFLSHEIIRLLTQPIIKSLLFHMVMDSKNMVELYAVAAIPQCTACDQTAYEALQNAFFSGYSHETSLTDDVLNNLSIFLRCQRITCDNIQTGGDADPGLEHLVSELCDRLGEDPNMKTPLAGYVPNYLVNEKARLDLDALEIYIMMQTEAYGAADDIYRFGHNSGSSSGATLFSLANNSNQDFSADAMMKQVIGRRRQYENATRMELAEIIRRTLQSVISYNAVIKKMQVAIYSCEEGSIESAREEWDMAVALFVGSLEGVLAGGRTDRHGLLMYALGNEFCEDFGTCETSGEATVNEQIMFDFVSGRDSMVDGECDHMKDLVSKSITPKLIIPHLQGIISSSIKINQNLSGNPEPFATAHVLSQTVIPLIDDLNTDSATVLTQAFGAFPTISSSPIVPDIVNAFGIILDEIGISCDAIGNPTGYALCTENEDGIEGELDSSFSKEEKEETPTDMADGLYITTTYVNDRANIALDVKDMSEALAEGNIDLARLIYSKGKNSEKFDEDGKFVRTRSLKWFSTKSTEYMNDEPEFNKFMYTLGNRVYADDLVEEALSNSVISNSEVATEAAMVLNLWMEIIHLMHEALQGCKRKELRDDDGVFLMDAAVAYWIGDGQVAGDGENGHLLYALSERFGQTFNIEDAGQSRTNTNILRLFNEAKNEISLPNACSDSQYTYTKLRGVVNRLIPQMAIPLIQGFINSLRENDRARVKIYSHAYIPLVASCSPSLFESLRQKLFSDSLYNVVEVESIIALIRESYQCLGLRCDDIGIHDAEKSGMTPECKDPDFDAHLAGYRPANDVYQYSRFDLDIREMDILLQMRAYSAVDELYTYGKHVWSSNGVSTSISQLAATKHRNIVPDFDSFVQYYSTDKFSDNIIRSAIDSTKIDFKDNWTDEQRRVVVIKATQVLVIYFAALQNAYEAVEVCSERIVESSQSSEPWDRAAALLIGSLEGTEKNGTSEGYMFYDLAQEHCVEFGTCIDETTTVQFNEELISLLYTGRGAALSNSCRALEKAADELSSLLLVPVIQGALSASTTLSAENKLEKRAEAYVYGRALVPFVRKRDAANDIDFYFGNPAPADKRHTQQKIYAALATAYPNMNIDCEDIGVSNGIDTCSGVVYVSDYLRIVGGVVAVILLLCCGVFGVKRYRQKSKLRKSEELRTSTRRFTLPRRRESNNHSMDLLEKAFSRPSPSTTPESLSHSDSDDEIEALNRNYLDSRASEIESFDDTFSDEDDDISDYRNEVIALTSKRHQGDDFI